jgi:two-component sensor histidine kinase
MAELQQETPRERLLVQQAALADFGTRALRSDDLDSLLQEACEKVADCMHLHFSKVLQLRPGGDLLICAGVGWRPGVVGNVVIEGDHKSAPGFALETGKPVISEDLTKEDRFEIPQVLIDHEVKSSVNVIIQGEGEPFGVFEVDSREFRTFTKDDINFLQTYANLLAAAIDRHSVSRALQEAVESKDALFHELAHRVKNNLQVILSLIQLQSRRAKSPEAAEELSVIGNRVRTLRLVHEKLFGSGELDVIQLAEYLRELCSDLMHFHEDEGRKIGLDLDVAPLRVSQQQAIPLGLVINEFITNSLKYAFGDGPGRIRVTLRPSDGGQARLVMSDNGKGLPAEFPSSSKGTGARIMEALVRQLGGRIEWRNENGACAILTFPLADD